MGSRLRWTGHVERVRDKKNCQKTDAQKVNRKGGEVERDYDGRTALRDTWKEREKSRKQEQEK